MYTIEKARDHGFNTGYAGGEMSNCPYGLNSRVSLRRKAWVEGFDAGVLKRCEEQSQDPTPPEAP